jgi:hypothetical protein
MTTLESIMDLKQTHRVLAEYTYTAPKLQRGYAGQTLYVNVATGHFEARPAERSNRPVA